MLWFWSSKILFLQQIIERGGHESQSHEFFHSGNLWTCFPVLKFGISVKWWLAVGCTANKTLEQMISWIEVGREVEEDIAAESW